MPPKRFRRSKSHKNKLKRGKAKDKNSNLKKTDGEQRPENKKQEKNNLKGKNRVETTVKAKSSLKSITPSGTTPEGAHDIKEEKTGDSSYVNIDDSASDETYYVIIELEEQPNLPTLTERLSNVDMITGNFDEPANDIRKVDNRLVRRTIADYNFNILEFCNIFPDFP